MDRRPPPTETDADASAPRGAAWLRRLGVAGFLFFLAKGLLWLALPTLVVLFGGGC